MRRQKPIVLGLTGGIASGKSTALKEFKKLGAEVIDSDKIAREIIRPGTAAWKAIISNFGKSVLRRGKAVNRKKLGELIFDDPLKRKKLEKITHPMIIAEIKKQINRLSKISRKPLIVLDAPLLFEAGIQGLADKTAVVWCSKKDQMNRLKKRDKLSDKEINCRLRAQIPLQKKKKLADIVINNSSSMKAVRKKVGRLWVDLSGREYL